MAKPVVNYIFPFDATASKNITFSYTGDLPYQNRLIIYNADTLDVIYDDISTSRVLYCTIPARICLNGSKYAAAIQCYDMNGTPSAISDKRYFWCLEQPTFYFSNVVDKQTVTTSSFYAEVRYNQSQNEALAQFQFFIYDSNKVLLSESQVFYSTDYLTYNYSGLEDDTVYFIRAKGLTQYGTALDTGYIEIDVNTSYDNTEFNKINAECNENNGLVTYYTNFKIVNSDEDARGYQYEDSIIDLTGRELNYSTGISVSGNFILCVKITNYYEAGTILTASDESDGFTLSTYIYDDSSMRFKLTVPNGLTPYILYSEPFMPTPGKEFVVYIVRNNNIYQLYVFTTTATTENDIHFGINEPDLLHALIPVGIDCYARSSRLENNEYDAYVVTRSSAPYTQYRAADVIAVRISEPNPDGALININSLGALPIYDFHVPIQANTFSHDGVYVFRLKPILPDEEPHFIAKYIEEIEIPTPDLHDVWVNNNNTPTAEILKGNINKFIMDKEPIVLADKRFDIWIGRWKE